MQNVRIITTRYVKGISHSIFQIDYGLEELSFECRQGKEVFSFPNCPDWLWGVKRLLINEYLDLFRE